MAPFLAGLGQAGLADWHGVDVPGLARAGFVSVTSATLATALVALEGIPLAYLHAPEALRLFESFGYRSAWDR